MKILKQKLLDYQLNGRPEAMPDYALHRLLFLLSTHPDMVRQARLNFLSGFRRKPRRLAVLPNG